MPYPESCPECGGAFRNSGTHFTARRNEIGRHVLLELGCQNTARRYWWDFTTGSVTEDGRTVPARRGGSPAAHASVNGTHGATATLTTPDDHLTLSPMDRADTEPDADFKPHARAAEVNGAADIRREARPDLDTEAPPSDGPPGGLEHTMASLLGPSSAAADETIDDTATSLVELAGPRPHAPAALKDAFTRQLQLDRLTLRQMRSWLMADDARRAIEVAAGATEATYERLALILFGAELGHLLGRPPAAAQSSGLSAEERLELQREKARLRARARRAAAKAARQTP